MGKTKKGIGNRKEGMRGEIVKERWKRRGKWKDKKEEERERRGRRKQK